MIWQLVIFTPHLIFPHSLIFVSFIISTFLHFCQFLSFLYFQPNPFTSFHFGTKIICTQGPFAVVFPVIDSLAKVYDLRVPSRHLTRIFLHQLLNVHNWLAVAFIPEGQSCLNIKSWVTSFPWWSYLYCFLVCGFWKLRRNWSHLDLFPILNGLIFSWGGMEFWVVTQSILSLSLK
jgi:uncharacterized RDD family membrane protein YckC